MENDPNFDPLSFLNMAAAPTHADVAFLESLMPQPRGPAVDRGEFTKGLQRGILNTDALLRAGAGTVFKLVGADNMADNQFQKYMELTNEASKIPAAVSDVRDAVTSPANFVNWAAAQLGEQVPVIASMVVTGGIGALTGRLVAKKAISELSADLIKKKAAEWAARGAIAGTFVGGTALETGGITGEQLEAGIQPRAGINLLGGSAAGALEVITPLTVAKMLGLKIPFATKLTNSITNTLAEHGILGRAAIGGTLIAGSEASTEALQEIIEIGVRKFVDENYDKLGDETSVRVLNAAAGGGLVGLVAGGLGGLRRHQALPSPIDETPPAATEQPPLLPAPQGLLPAPEQQLPTMEQYRALQDYEAGQIRARNNLADSITIFTNQGILQQDADEVARRQQEVTTGEGTPFTQAQVIEDNALRVERYNQNFETPIENPQLDRLLNVRKAILELQKFRDENGELLPKAAKRLEQINQTIDELTKANEDQVRRSTNLSEQENTRLAYLTEKERTDGLTQREYDQYEKLIARLQGEQKAERRPASEAQINALEQEVESALKQEKPLYSTTQQRTTGMTEEEFRAAIAPVMIPGTEANFEVLNHPRELPTQDLQEHAIKAELNRRKPEALYSPRENKAYFFLNNLNAERAPKVYLHEALAHYGLHNVLPQDTLNSVVNLVDKSNKEWIDNYLKERPQLQNNRAVAAEEYIAKIAEDGGEANLLQRVIALIRQWLRKILPNLKFTDTEVKAMLQSVKKDLSTRVINNYLPPDLVRNVLESDETNRGLTMRIVQALQKKNKDWTSRGEVESEMNRLRANKEERKIVEMVLNLPQMGRKFQIRTFADELKKFIIPLQPNETSTYANYGLRNIGFDVDNFRRSNNYSFARSVVYTAPFKTPKNDHFGTPSGYVGHVRYFVKTEGAAVIKSLSEVQSDLEQRQVLSALTPEEIATRTAELQNELAFVGQMFQKIQEIRYGRQTNEMSDTDLIAEIKKLYVEWVSDSRAEDPAVLESQDLNRMFDVLDSIEEDMSTQAAEVDRDLRQVQSHANGPYETEQKATIDTIYQRMIREEVRDSGMKHYDKMRLASPYTVAQIEGWVDKRTLFAIRNADAAVINAAEHGRSVTGPVTEEERAHAGRRLAILDKLQTEPEKVIEILPDKVKRIAIRYNDLAKFVKREYGAKLVEDNFGNTWYEWGVDSKIGDEPVIAYASDSAQDASNLHGNLDIRDNKLPKDLDRWSNLWRMQLQTVFLSPLQLAQRYGLEPIKRYMNIVDTWARTKSEIIQPADEVVGRWINQPKDQAQRISTALFETAAESDDLHRALTPNEEAAILRKHKLEGEALQIYQDVRNTFKSILARLEAGLKYNAALETIEDSDQAKAFVRQWNDAAQNKAAKMKLVEDLAVNPQVSINLGRRMLEIEKDIDLLRNKNYFPYMRFGQWTVTVRATIDDQAYKGATYKKGQNVQFWTFESKKEQEAFFRSEEADALRRQKFNLAMSKMEDTEFSFMGMPPSLIDAIDKEVDLTSGQRDQLKDFFIKHSPGRAFLRHLLRRKGIEGFSYDAMRVYATYMMNAANHLARVEHFIDMDKALADLKGYRDTFENASADSRGLMVLYNSFQKHRQYIMNPGNDLAKYRALGFMWYLGFNVKSAVVNSTQVPMVTYPYLAARHGDAASLGALIKASKDAFAVMRKQSLDPMEDKLVARGIKEGFLDESLATELAGISEGSALARILPQDKAHRLTNQTAYYGSFMFRMAEKFTRITAFLAAARLAKNTGVNEEGMYQAGKEAVRATLFEYAKWNRPEFMRGKKSIFFLFWTYMQNMAYTAFGGQGANTAMRIWLMLMLAGGLQGLPFMENLLDLIDFGKEKIKKTLGMKDPYSDLRTDIRNLLLEITDSPDIVMHGMSRYWGLGPLHLLELMGVPVPNTDVSGSISVGNVIPGIRELFAGEASPDERFGRTIAQIMGPVFGMPYMLWRASEDNNPDTWKRWERAMPSMIKAGSKAMRFATRGEEEFRGGGAVAKFDQNDMLNRAEEIAQGLGFTPTRIAQRYELSAAQQNIKEYYSVRRAMLLDDYAFLIQHRDPEAAADLRRAIHDFNTTAPSPALRITADTLKRSLEQRQKLATAREQGTTLQKTYKPLYRETAQAYPETNIR